MWKKSKTNLHFKTSQTLIPRDRKKGGKKGGKIPINPKTIYILRIQSLYLFPEKYIHILNKTKKDIFVEAKEILKLDKKRRFINKNTKSGKEIISESINEIKKRISKEVEIFPYLSYEEWKDLVTFSIYYELENWYKYKKYGEKEQEKTIRNAKNIVRGRIFAKVVWWKDDPEKKKYWDMAMKIHEFISKLSEEEYHNRLPSVLKRLTK